MFRISTRPPAAVCGFAGTMASLAVLAAAVKIPASAAGTVASAGASQAATTTGTTVAPQPAPFTGTSTPFVARSVFQPPSRSETRPASPSATASPAVSPENPRDIAQYLAAQRGWTGWEWTCLDELWRRESNYETTATNPASGAYGIPQALPAEKMASAGPDWRTDPVTQITWGLDYIASRYGEPCTAWRYWLRAGSY